MTSTTTTSRVGNLLLTRTLSKLRPGGLWGPDAATARGPDPGPRGPVESSPPSPYTEVVAKILGFWLDGRAGTLT